MKGNYRHMMYGTPTYRSYHKMIERCSNPKSNRFSNYGGRGIRVCTRWDNFETFFLDMGVRPDGTTLDRVNVDGNYEPGNCRWATKKEQSRNKQSTRFISANGETLPAIEWAERIGVGIHTLLARIDRYGMTPEQAISHVKHSGNGRRK